MIASIQNILKSDKKHKEKVALLVKKAKLQEAFLSALFELLKKGTNVEKGTCAEVMKFVSKENPDMFQSYIDILIEYINDKAKKILYQNYKGENPDQMLSTADQAVQLINESNEKVIILIDLRDSFFNDKFFKKIKELINPLKEKIKKSSILGIHGIKKIIFQTIISIFGQDGIKTFNNEEEAKEYLIKD